MKYKLIIFDLDGTILDTIGDLADSVNFALQSCSLPERSLSEVRQFVGNGIKRLIERSVPTGCENDVTDRVLEIFRNYYKEHNSIKTKPYDGIISLLRHLKDRGIERAVVSNKTDAAVKKLVGEYFDGLFSYSSGDKEGVPRKPEPYAVFNAIDYFGVTAADTLYIGDSEVDIDTARNAGIDSIIVTWGFRDRDFLEEHKAEKLVSDINELISVLF